jgi:hypothetical protein
MKRKPKVGETLYIAARHRAQVLVPVVVESVGTKYFKCGNGTLRGFEFKIEDWRERTEYTPNYCLYETEQEWRDKQESDAICNDIRESFAYGNKLNLDIEELREIRAIMRRESFP